MLPGPSFTGVSRTSSNCWQRILQICSHHKCHPENTLIIQFHVACLLVRRVAMFYVRFMYPLCRQMSSHSRQPEVSNIWGGSNRTVIKIQRYLITVHRHTNARRQVDICMFYTSISPLEPRKNGRVYTKSRSEALYPAGLMILLHQ